MFSKTDAGIIKASYNCTWN